MLSRYVRAKHSGAAAMVADAEVIEGIS